MGVEITGGDNTVSATADSDTSTPLTVAGHSITQSAPLILGQVNNGGTLYNFFALEEFGQLRVIAEDGDAGTFPGGLKLVRKFGAGGTDIDVENDANSVNLLVAHGLTGKYEAFVEAFSAGGSTSGGAIRASVMMSDDLISNNVALGWILCRTLFIDQDAGGSFQIGDGGGSVATISHSLNFSSTFILKDPAGRLVTAGNSGVPSSGEMGGVDATNQSASIASTNLANTVAAGCYVVHYTLGVTATQAGAASVQFAIAYTDDVGATTQTGAAISLTGANRDRGTFEVHIPTTSSITYTATVVGAVGTGRYALRARIEALG